MSPFGLLLLFVVIYTAKQLIGGVSIADVVAKLFFLFLLPIAIVGTLLSLAFPHPEGTATTNVLRTAFVIMVVTAIVATVSGWFMALRRRRGSVN
ncbi:MAG: hypothetical protein WBD86_01850 [Microgenomates group bacterium]